MKHGGFSIFRIKVKGKNRRQLHRLNRLLEGIKQEFGDSRHCFLPHTSRRIEEEFGVLSRLKWWQTIERQEDRMCYARL
jgi:hypothetical protein